MSIKKNHKQIAIWLFVNTGMVFAMVVIGAITRLTESGLSMVEWRPLIGAMPPLSEAEWIRVFDLYKATPEFQKINFWMGMEDFKTIFFWEWFHRLWGRLIGLVYALPLAYFWVRSMIPKGYHLPLFGLLILGGMQGFMGWYMVQSGLVDMPAVSHFRLAAHLSLAFVIAALLVTTALKILRFKGPTQQQSLPKEPLWLVLGLYIMTAVWGAYVAGLDAGMIYNEFPTMGASLIPPEITGAEHTLSLFINDHAAVQFTHRVLATFSILTVISLWAAAAISQKAGWPLHILCGLFVLQYSLGIWTILSQVALPIATLHQAVALLILLSWVVNIRTRKHI